MFDEIPDWSYGCEPAKQRSNHEELELIRGMNGLGKKPIKYILCITCYSKMLNWRLGLQIHARVIQMCQEENLFISSALVDVEAKFCA